MKSSIRKFLLINLLIAILITTSLTAIGNYYLDQKDIKEHLDMLMAVSALSYQALLGDDVRERSLNKIQDNLKNITNKIEAYRPKRHIYKIKEDYFLNKFNSFLEINILVLHNLSKYRLFI